MKEQILKPRKLFKKGLFGTKDKTLILFLFANVSNEIPIPS